MSRYQLELNAWLRRTQKRLQDEVNDSHCDAKDWDMHEMKRQIRLGNLCPLLYFVYRGWIMGLDASIVALPGKQSFYFDRLYNLVPNGPFTGEDVDFIDECQSAMYYNRGQIDGAMRTEVIDYLEKLIHYYAQPEAEEEEISPDGQAWWCRKVLEWVKTRPNTERFVIIDMSSDEYYELPEDGRSG